MLAVDADNAVSPWMRTTVLTTCQLTPARTWTRPSGVRAGPVTAASCRTTFATAAPVGARACILPAMTDANGQLAQVAPVQRDVDGRHVGPRPALHADQQGSRHGTPALIYVRVIEVVLKDLPYAMVTTTTHNHDHDDHDNDHHVLIVAGTLRVPSAGYGT